MYTKPSEIEGSHMAQLVLSEEESTFLYDVLEWWKEGYADAKDATIADIRSIVDFDQLLELCADYDAQTSMILNMQWRLKHG